LWDAIFGIDVMGGGKWINCPKDPKKGKKDRPDFQNKNQKRPIKPHVVKRET